MPYQEILARAWHIFKRQRALWLFGFLTACSGGVYGKLNLSSFNFQMPNFQSFQTGANGQPPSIPPEVEQFFEQMAQIPDQTWLLIVLGFLLLGLAWTLLIMLLRSFAEPALVRGILEAIENDRPLTISEITHAGTPFFGRMLLFHLLVGGSALVAVTIFATSFALIAIGTLGIGLICLLPLMLLLIPAAWLLELYLVFATMALILEDLDVIAALKRGWQMLKQNFWSSVLMGMLLTVIRIAASFLIGLLLVGLLIPVVASIIFIATTTESIVPILVLIALAVVFAVILSLAAMGLLQTYLESAWVLAYRHFLGYSLDPEAPALPDSAQEILLEEEGEEASPQKPEPPLPAPETS